MRGTETKNGMSYALKATFVALSLLCGAARRLDDSISLSESIVGTWTPVRVSDPSGANKAGRINHREFPIYGL
jgi:hypothetical protein